MYLDRFALEEILTTTSSILEKHFFYDGDGISRFLDIFLDVIEHELNLFELQAHPETIIQIKYDRNARFFFTLYFVSINLRQIMIEHLHFTELELKAFDSVLPKYSEVENVEPYSQRAHY